MSPEYEWHPEKSASNLAKHKIDFELAVRVFEKPWFEASSDRNGEKRWIAIGEVDGIVIVVVFTRRAATIRVISARRARKNEEKAYRQIRPK